MRPTSWLSVPRYLKECFLNRRIRLHILSVFGYVFIGLILIRLNFSPSGLPLGTNILGSFMGFVFNRRFGLTTWTPVTDWGQPLPGFMGPTLLYALSLLINPTTLIRLTEFFSFSTAGITAYYLFFKLVNRPGPSFVSGLYYMLMTETGQFFDGHLPLMITFSLLPLFFYILYYAFNKPTIMRFIILAILLYLLTSIGDLGGLYIVLFYAIPFAVYLIFKRFASGKNYSIYEVLSILIGALMFLSFVLTWFIPYMLGVRPEYTTNITTNIIGFYATAGVSPALSFIGFIADNSYTLFALHHTTYELFPGTFIVIYFALPIILLFYVIKKRNKALWLLYAVASFSFLISTGAVIPILSFFNQFLYDYIPFFDSIPALFRYTVFTVFAYSIISLFLLCDLVDFVSSKCTNTQANPQSHFIRIRSMSFKDYKKTLAIICILLVLITPFLQNFEVLSVPPGEFNFPAQYTAAYSDISGNTSGNVLTIPFGVTYERTPWGMVSQSSSFMSPYYSNRNVVLFEAGTSYSRAMDFLVGNGLTYGLSNNMTKFLEAVNVKYIVSTNYTNWEYASSSIYNPPQSYFALENQTGLGTPINYSNLQQVYTLNNISSSVSFSSTYFVFYGNDGLLYEIFNEPWYLGSSTPLINGIDLNNTPSEIISHAAGIIVSPSALQSLSNSVILSAAKSNVPFFVIENYTDVQGNGLKTINEPWISSNSISFTSSTGKSNVYLKTELEKLNVYGYNSSLVYARSMSLGKGFSEMTYNRTAVNLTMGKGISTFYNKFVGYYSLANESAVPLCISNNTYFDTFTQIVYTHSYTNSTPSFEVLNKSNPTDEKYNIRLETKGWGIVVLDQTYNPLWQFSGSTIHIVADVGLNAWLINSSLNISAQILFIGNHYLFESELIEPIFISVVILIALVVERYNLKSNRHNSG